MLNKKLVRWHEVQLLLQQLYTSIQYLDIDRRITDCWCFPQIVKLIESRWHHLQGRRRTTVCCWPLRLNNTRCPGGGSSLVSSHLRVFATEVAVHGGAGGHLSPTEVARLGFHLLVSQVDVLLQHVLGQVLLITCCTRPRLAHCGKKIEFKSPYANSNIYVTEVSADLFYGSLFLPRCRQLHLIRSQTSKRFCWRARNWCDCDARDLPVWISLCVSRVVLSLKVFPHSSHIKSFIPAGKAALQQTGDRRAWVGGGYTTYLCASYSVSACWPSGQTCGCTLYTHTLWFLCEASCGASERVLSSFLSKSCHLNLHICAGRSGLFYYTLQKQIHRPFPHSAHRKSRISSCTLRCSFSMSFLAKDLLHLSQRWLFTPESFHNQKRQSGKQNN